MITLRLGDLATTEFVLYVTVHTPTNLRTAMMTYIEIVDSVVSAITKLSDRL